MEQVASHLKSEAFKPMPEKEKDCFGRSAFNRYYYAVFLEVRSELSQIKPEWGHMPHATLPDLLKGQILTKIKSGMRRANKLGDFSLVGDCKRADSAIHDLVKLIELGRSVRVAADYHPDIPIKFFLPHSFSLNHTKIEDAEAWLQKTRNYLKVIVNTWKQLNA